MIPAYPRQGWPGFARLLPLLLAASALADGELDPDFRPAPAAGHESNQDNKMRVTADGIHLYGINQAPVRRLRFDGSPDASWKLQDDDPGMDIKLVPLPAGGWVVAGILDKFRFVHPDGTVVPVPGIGDPLIHDFDPLPIDDGSVLVVNNGEMARLLPDGRMGFHRPLDLLVVGDDPDAVQSPGWSTACVGGPDGGFVVAGNVWHRNPYALGLVRYRADGGFDGSWNPWMELDLGDATRMTSVPRLPAMGPDGSVVVLRERDDGDGTWRAWMSKIDVAGHVAWDREVVSRRILKLLVQPDGKILCAGGFTNWGGQAATGLVRLLPDGTRDPGFDVVLGRTNGPVDVNSLDFDRDGDLYLSGFFDSVNHEPRPGLARVRVFSPPDTHPNLDMPITPKRVATGEFLTLVAEVGGRPYPTLQWWRNGEPIPGATNRYLRWFVADESSAGTFTLAATNAFGTSTITPPRIEVTMATPRPETGSIVAKAPVPGMALATQAVPLPDGRLLLAGGDAGIGRRVPLLARLRRDFSPDPTFGDGGTVFGTGIVESVELLADGGLRVAGSFGTIGTASNVGLVEMDADGKLRSRDFPAFDVPHATATLSLPGGGLMVAGFFEKAGTTAAHRLVRLKADLTPDPDFQSPLAPFVLVDAMAVDPLGRLVIAGGRAYRDTPGELPAGIGVLRLKRDGNPDPSFVPYRQPTRNLAMDSDGRMIVGPPAVGLGINGGVDMRSAVPPGLGNFFAMDLYHPEHLLVRTADGGVIYPVYGPTQPSGKRAMSLRRWHSDGSVDEWFAPAIAPNDFYDYRWMAMALEADGSLVFAYVPAPEEGAPPEYRVDVRRFLPDPDRRVSARFAANGKVRIDVPTRPGALYSLEAAPGLPGAPIFLPMLSGDGHVQSVEVPATGAAGFLRVNRQ